MYTFFVGLEKHFCLRVGYSAYLNWNMDFEVVLRILVYDTEY